MRLLLREKDGAAREFQFAKGPVSIGRAADSHVFLPDRAVSRQHAVLHSADDGKWLVEDLDSASKTYLNDQAVRKAQIKHGDLLRVATFTMEIALEEAPMPQAPPLGVPSGTWGATGSAGSPKWDVEAPQAPAPAPVAAPQRAETPSVEAREAIQMDATLHLEAALATPPHETVVRTPDDAHAPAMRLAANRLTDFSRATERICQAKSLDDLLLTLLALTLEEFDASVAWCALRTQPTGPMTRHAGRKKNGSAVDLAQIPLQQKVIQAVERGQFLVMPRVSAQIESEDAIRSAMIAAIMRPTGCFGVLYVDNSMKAKHYSLSDLDYLMLVAMHTAAVMRKFLELPP
jgi:pSer/pThr/pTyr-binding forkhead associated (FHA) protein